MKPQNLKRHSEKCIIHREFNLPKSEILIAIGRRPSNSGVKDLEVLNEKLSADNLRLMEILKKFFEEAKTVVFDHSENSDSHSKINQMCLSEETIKEYQGEWKIFRSWCLHQNLSPMNPSSANSYLARLKLEVSTIKKKRNRLQSIIRHLTGQSIFLTRIRRRIRRMPKYKMSYSEISEYLEEQRSLDLEDYLIQLILATYGCRIHSCSSLKLRNLHFLNGGSVIYLPDTKTGDREVEVSKTLRQGLNKYIKMKKLTDPEAFVFSAGSSENSRRRANILCVRINNRIKESKVLNKNANFKFSSHMFRHSVAFQVYRDYLEIAKEAARKSIGHRSVSSSINFYIK